MYLSYAYDNFTAIIQVEHKIWQQIDIEGVRIQFMKGNGTTDATFTVRQMQEKFTAKEKRVCFGFVDLENFW